MRHVVIVGAGVAGLKCAEALRRYGYTDEITIVGAETRHPYNRPLLSKEVLAEWNQVEYERLALPVSARLNDVAWRLGDPVIAADLEHRRLRLSSGMILEWDGLVVASGLRPRRLLDPGLDGAAYVLRDLDDAVRLRRDLRPDRSVVVLGAGFVGCEVAAAARRRGAEVTVIGSSAHPFQASLGAVVGDAVRRRHERMGVRFFLGRFVTGCAPRASGYEVHTDRGESFFADVLVQAIGAAPATDWLAGTEVDLSDGVRCDAFLRVLTWGGDAIPGVVACGDVARFPLRTFPDVERRIEHWTVATETARLAGRTLAAQLCGDHSLLMPLKLVPTFWSDQYDWRLSCVGLPELGDGRTELLAGDMDGNFALAYYQGSKPVGVAALGLTGRLPEFHSLVAEAFDLESARA